ncbi:membrane protein, partial [Aggregatibacter actinomycetemcomitans serotype d str. SA3733]
NTPVYTLDEKNPRDMMIKQAAKGIRVEQGRLEVDTFDNLLKP